MAAEDVAEAPVQTDPTTDAPTDWSPPAVEAETGVALIGDYPANHRLRAEALSKARRKSDPDGVISDELIAGTADRLRAERADAKGGEG